MSFGRLLRKPDNKPIAEERLLGVQRTARPTISEGGRAAMVGRGTPVRAASGPQPTGRGTASPTKARRLEAIKTRFSLFRNFAPKNPK
jgi:hypothetical protein